jgi:uncharacterized membrane protein
VRVKKLAKEVVSHVVGDRCIRIKVSKKMTAQSQSALYSLLALKPCMVIWMFWDACIWMVAAVCHAAKLLVSLTVVCFVQYVSGWVSPYTRALLLAIWTISHRVCFICQPNCSARFSKLRSFLGIISCVLVCGLEQTEK